MIKNLNLRDSSFIVRIRGDARNATEQWEVKNYHKVTLSSFFQISSSSLPMSITYQAFFCSKFYEFYKFILWEKKDIAKFRKKMQEWPLF